MSTSQGAPRIVGTRRGEEEDGMGQILLESLQRKHGLLTPCFGLVVSRNVGEYTSVV